MKVVKTFIRDFILLVYWGPVRVVLQNIPARVLYGVVDGAASVIFLFTGSRLKAVCRRFCLLCGHEFSDARIRALALEGLRMSIKSKLEMLILSALDQKWADQMIVSEGLEHLDAALSRGKGAIIQVAHFGNFLLPVVYLGLKGYPVTQITREPEYRFKSALTPYLTRLRHREDEKVPIRYFSITKSFKSIIGRLKNNELVAIAIDGRNAQNFVTVDFLGKKAKFAPGMIRLAEMAGAPILPAFAVRRPDGSQKVIVGPPYDVLPDEDKETMIQRNLEKLLAVTENYVRTYPDHFFMNFRPSSKLQVDRPLFEDFMDKGAKK